jgi:hypothetical protein
MTGLKLDRFPLVVVGVCKKFSPFLRTELKITQVVFELNLEFDRTLLATCFAVLYLKKNKKKLF